MKHSSPVKKSSQSTFSNDSPSDSFTTFENRKFSRSTKAWITHTLNNHREKNPKYTLRDAINLHNKKRAGNKAGWTRYKNSEKKAGKRRYSESGRIGEINVPEPRHTRPKSTTKAESKAKPKKSLSQWKKEQKKALSDYLQSEQYRNTSTYKRVKTGHKSYPDATKYELSHGLNSKVSREYRLRHGLNEKYSGRVKK